jgi:hypothetical protein
MLDAAYVASMMEEEGRRVGFTLAYLSQRGARQLGHRVFPFRTPLPLRPSHLAKYALAAAPLTTSFGVWPAKGQLHVWGITHHGNHTFDIDLSFLPTYLSVRVVRTGTFTAHFDGRLLLLFSRDHVRLFDADADQINLVDILRDRLRLDPNVAVALQRVGQRMVALGHGGTILVTKKGKARKGLKMHGALTGRAGGLTLLKEVVDVDRRRATGVDAPTEPVREGTAVHQRYTQDEKHREALDFVAQLTAVDGAVVLDEELSIYGFGATISTKRALPAVTTEHPAELGKKRKYDIERRGNRHRSATSVRLYSRAECLEPFPFGTRSSRGPRSASPLARPSHQSVTGSSQRPISSLLPPGHRPIARGSRCADWQRPHR